MVKHADLLICDSEGIEKYIQKEYKKYNPKTMFIPYGAQTSPSTLADDDPKVVEWYDKHQVRPSQYYLMVGRFVPENNFETIIKEFMMSNTKKDLVIISYYKNTPLYDLLVNEYKIDSDPRIKLVGTLYDEQLLKKIRENAYAYIHGHSVGGTNPSLLEALARTDVNLVYDVSFNKEVAKDGAIYWSEEYALLRNLIKRCDEATIDKRYELGLQAKARIEGAYTWDKIIDQYEELFLGKEQTAEKSNS